MAQDDVRPSIIETNMEVAQAYAKRATCLIKKVGCVITDEKHNVLSTGYNGQPRGMHHCSSLFPCDAWRDSSKSCLAIHAEINALLRCNDVDKIYNVYVTTKPCLKCALAIANTNCSNVVYIDDNLNKIIINPPFAIVNMYDLSAPRF